MLEPYTCKHKCERDELKDEIHSLRTALAAETERCAKIAETAYERWAGQDPCPVNCDVTACAEIAAAIRASGTVSRRET